MLVATAGHIDHGKTSLIRALTGVETDRLPEERARGISIDLGFAYWTPDDAPTIGFVDVPGHERYVRNMLAGVGGVDYAVLVVAADDGVMPQSLEHVQILDLHGIARGAVAITKCDRASRERIDEVRHQVRALLSSTSLAGAPLFEVSTVTGAGIASLTDALRIANRVPATRPFADRNFRLAIDRAFTVTGAGTVVTGTVREGSLEPGTRLMLSPRPLEVRVRGLQSAGNAIDRVQAGERCAINLTGVEVGQIRRGDWLIAAPMHAPTRRIEVQLQVLNTHAAALKHDTPVHLHLGTADIPARALFPRQRTIAPGATAIAHLVLDHPTCAVVGDRFVLRDHSGRTLIGGGIVVDPFAPTDRRRPQDRAAVSAALQLVDPQRALTALLAIPGYEVDTLQFERRFNLTSQAARLLYQATDAVLLDTTPALALPATRIADITQQVIASLENFHREHPDVPGMSPRQLKTSLTTPISTDAFLSLQKTLMEKRLIAASGANVKLPAHFASFSAADEERWQRVENSLQRRGAQPFTAAELVKLSGLGESLVKSMLYRRRAAGDVWRIDDERFLLRQQVAFLAALAAALSKQAQGKGFTAAQFRDASGVGRNMVIRILEFFDAIGVTRRDGNCRRTRQDYHLVVGVETVAGR